jgi:small-conductance mechanosensitive channel
MKTSILTHLMETRGITRILLIAAILLVAHFSVVLIRRTSKRFLSDRYSQSVSRTKTVISLLLSVSIFSLYFGAVGLVVTELGISIKAYLASASILGLAIGFGSQNFVQDLVSGLTVIFSGLFDVGEMVEISGQTGIVKSIGLRFTVLENSMGAEVFIPNRKIENVLNYPRGYVRCLADVTLPADPALSERMESLVEASSLAVYEEFPGIVLTPPSLEGKETTKSGKTYLRVKFRLWPGRGDLIEKTFKPEIVQVLKAMDPTYGDWMVAVNFEVEKKSISRFGDRKGPGRST